MGSFTSPDQTMFKSLWVRFRALGTDGTSDVVRTVLVLVMSIGCVGSEYGGASRSAGSSRRIGEAIVAIIVIAVVVAIVIHCSCISSSSSSSSSTPFAVH